MEFHRTPGLVDAIARGEAKDSGLTRLTAEELPEYEACKARHYAVREEGDGLEHVEILFDWWCTASNLPRMTIWNEGDDATIFVEPDPTWIVFGYSFRLDRAAQARIAELFQDAEHVAPDESRFHGWTTRAEAPAIAAKMWEIMTPFFKTPEYRDLKIQLGTLEPNGPPTEER